MFHLIETKITSKNCVPVTNIVRVRHFLGLLQRRKPILCLDRKKSNLNVSISKKKRLCEYYFSSTNELCVKQSNS